MKKALRRWGPDLSPAISVVALLVGGTLAAAGMTMEVAVVLAALGDARELLAFGATGVAVMAIGFFLVAMGASADRQTATLKPYAGFLGVTLSWTSAAVVGAIPLLLAGVFDSPIDAFFEATSGFTTTGATLLEDFNQPDIVFWWRSLMQYLGGIGIVVLVVAIAPVSGAGMQKAFYAEVSGVTAERLTPRIIDTAKILASIYGVITVAALIAYLSVGLNLFDAANHTMTTVATGGFSTEPFSIGGFDSLGVEMVALVFIIISGVNFAFYWRAIKGGKLMPQLAEVRIYLVILAVMVTAVTASVMIENDVGNFGQSLRASAFSVTTVMTGTGYVTADFDEWNNFARIAFLFLMFTGACAGSTAGGMKVIRISLLLKSARQELERQLRPNQVQVLRMGGQTFSEQVRRAVLAFFLLYVIVFIAGSIFMGATGVDMVTALSAASTTLNIVGPGLGDIGALDSFGAVPEPGRLVGALLMITGRLEIFTVVALFAPIFRMRPNLP